MSNSGPASNHANVHQIARELLQQAAHATAQRAATTIFGGRDNVMRQTVVALASGTALTEHESPGETTLYVIEGRVELRAGPEVVDASAGELVVVPSARHSLLALEDSAVLLTAVPREFLPQQT